MMFHRAVFISRLLRVELCPVSHPVFRSALLSTLLLGALSGCQILKQPLEPDRPLEMTGAVTLRTPSPIYTEGMNEVRIVSVDEGPPFPYDYEAIVSPGRHSFQLDVNYTVPTSERTNGVQERTTRALESIEFSGKPGREYRIQVLQLRGGPLHIWIIDEATKDVVAGNAP